MPFEETYDEVVTFIDHYGEYDFPFTILNFGDLIEDVTGTLIPRVPVDYRESAIFKASIYVGAENAEALFSRLQTDVSVQIRHLNLPRYPANGFQYRYYMTNDLNLHIHHEYISSDHQLTQTQTRDDIIASIENGDYISERIRRQFGV